MSKVPGGAMIAPIVSKAIKGMVTANNHTDYAG